MRYSIEPRDRIIYVKDFEFISFAKNIGKNLNSKYSQKPCVSAKKIGNEITADAIKTASKKVIKKTTEAIGDLICNKLVIK